MIRGDEQGSAPVESVCFRGTQEACKQWNCMQGYDGQFMWKGAASGKWRESSVWRARRFARFWRVRCRPGYQRQKPVRRPKLGPLQAAIDAILEQDKSCPRKQRHSAKRIFERLRNEHGYVGGYTIVKDYVRPAKIGVREMFGPPSHEPGEAQADFGEAVIMIGRVERAAHYLAFDLPHSDDCFVVAFPAETPEEFLEGCAGVCLFWRRSYAHSL
jgi:transposase